MHEQIYFAYLLVHDVKFALLFFSSFSGLLIIVPWQLQHKLNYFIINLFLLIKSLIYGPLERKILNRAFHYH